MNNTTNKSANQLYKESGSTLSFKDWIEREKAKGIDIPNIGANEAMLNMMDEAQEARTSKDEKTKDKKVVIIRNVAITLTILTLGIFAYRMINKKNNE